MVNPSFFPSKYPVVKLGDVVVFLDNLRRPVKAEERKEGAYPYFGANGQQGAIDGYIFDESLVLLAEDGGHFLNPERGIAYKVDGKCWVNNHAHVLRPTDQVDVNFLAWQLRHYDVRKFVTGATRLKLTKTNAGKIPLTLPPLREQERIAGILDKAGTVRRKRKHAIELVDEFLRSVFLDMFGDPVTNPKGWDVLPFKQVGKIVTGNTPSRKNEEYYGQGIEWIKSDNINTPSHYLTAATEHLTEEGKKKGRIAPAGAILVTCIAGSKSCIGNAALAKYEVAFNQQINAVIPFEITDSAYLYSLLFSCKKIVQSASTESMKGLVSKGKFEAIDVIYPPQENRMLFANIFEKIDKLRNKLIAQYEDSEELFASLLQKAFKGEL